MVYKGKSLSLPRKILTGKSIITLLKMAGEYAEPEVSKLGSQISNISKSKKKRLVPGAEETAESTGNTSNKETAESVKPPKVEVKPVEIPKAKRPKITLKKRAVVSDVVSKIQGEEDADEVYTATSTGTNVPVEGRTTEATPP